MDTATAYLDEARRALRGHKKGDAVKVEVLRNKAVRTLTATLEERPRRDMEWEDFGELRDLPGMLRREFRSHPFTVEVPEPHGAADFDTAPP